MITQSIRHFSKKNIKLDEAISHDNTHILERRSILEEITKKINKLITAANITSIAIEMEISHHYGLEKFNNMEWLFLL